MTLPKLPTPITAQLIFNAFQSNRLHQTQKIILHTMRHTGCHTNAPTHKHTLIKMHTIMAICTVWALFFLIICTILTMKQKFTKLNLPAIIQIGHCSEFTAVGKENCVLKCAHKLILWIIFFFLLSCFEEAKIFASDYFVCYNCTGCGKKKLLLRCRCNCIG